MQKVPGYKVTFFISEAKTSLVASTQPNSLRGIATLRPLVQMKLTTEMT